MSDDPGAVTVAEPSIRDIGYVPVLVGGLEMGKYLMPGTPLAGEHTLEEIRRIAAALERSRGRADGMAGSAGYAAGLHRVAVRYTTAGGDRALEIVRFLSVVFLVLLRECHDYRPGLPSRLHPA